MKRNLPSVVFIASLSFISGCGKELGDHGSNREIELILKGGGSITLICPEFDREPGGAHGRECYIKKGSLKPQKLN